MKSHARATNNAPVKDFAPTLLPCGLFLAPRSPRGTCVECWGKGTSQRTGALCRCSADSPTPCVSGQHFAPGYQKIATNRRPTTGAFVETIAGAARAGQRRRAMHA